MTHLCITVRWMDGRYHGLLSREGPPEWPPSPYRLFQALVAGVARHGQLGSEIGGSIEWLETLHPPMIVAPRSCPGQVMTRFVPNNDGDKVPNRQGRLTGKTSQPTILLDSPTIHYVWTVGVDTPLAQAEGAIRAAYCLSCFGLGIDMAYGDGQLMDDAEVHHLTGIRWFPHPGSFRDDGLLRVPRGGSLADLLHSHDSFLRRIEHGKPLRAVDKPKAFDHVFYASVERPSGKPCVAFSLRTANDDTYRYPHAKLMHVAGMTRSASIKAMIDYPPATVLESEDWIKSFVAGHRPDGQNEHQQFSYTPLSSIGHEHADAMIRRVMIVAPFGQDACLRHLADQLDGVQLQPEDGAEGPILDRVRSDGVVRQYLTPARRWASVTPIILPGHDDHKPAKTVRLIEKALRQSGVEQGCKFTWGAMPNFKNCLSAHKANGSSTSYFRPNHLKDLTAVHIQITFEHPVAGPLAIGAGRHCGFGVLAARPEA